MGDGSADHHHSHDHTAHAGWFAGGQLDLLLDGTVPMGSASVQDVASRRLDVFAAGLPVGSQVEVVAGAIDGTGVDPNTQVVATIAAASFGSSGLASVTLDTSTAVFARAQVRNSAGSIVGIGNPVYSFRTEPATGIPAQRRVLTA